MKINFKSLTQFGLVALVFAVISGIIVGSLSCQSGYSGAVESISIGTTTNEVNSLILIAQDQGYFTRNGLDVTQNIYPSGVAALDGVLNNEVDLAAGSEFAFVGEVLTGQSITTISAISRSAGESLVCRTDRGISAIDDLEGKTIGAPLGSRPEFALDRFLYFQRFDTSEVTLVNVPVNKSVEALVNGEVDAVATWQPYIDRIKEQMGGGVIIWDVQEDQPSYTLVKCKAELPAKNPEAVKRFLKSLVEAENYLVKNPEAVKAFIQNKLNYTEDYVKGVWPDYNFSVSLDQTLIVAMEDQARWIINKNLTSGKNTPNFLEYMYFQALEDVKPEAVNVIR